MKKLASLVGAGAMLLTMAVPSFAFWGSDVAGNFATVFTTAFTKADSGDNHISGMTVTGGKIETSTAKATAEIGNMVNTLQKSGCSFCSSTDVVKNMAFVSTKATTKADSGDNHISGMFVSGGKISAGAATGSTLISNIVNSVVVPATQ